MKINNLEMQMPMKFTDDLASIGSHSFYLDNAEIPESVKTYLRSSAINNEILEDAIKEEIYYIDVTTNEGDVENPLPAITGISINAIIVLNDDEYGGEQRECELIIGLSKPEWGIVLQWLADTF